MAADNIFDLNSVTLIAASESADGRPINLAGGTTQANAILLHRSTSEPDEWDQMYATVSYPNFAVGASPAIVGIGWGGSSLPVANADVLVVSVTTKTTVLAVGPDLLRGGNSIWGWVATGSDAGVNVKVWGYRYKAKSDAAAS